MNRSQLSDIRPQQALQSYLDGLLQDAFEDLPAADGPALDDFERAVQLEQQRDAERLARSPVLERTQPLVLPTVRLPVAEPVVEAPVVAEPVVEVAVQVEPQALAEVVVAEPVAVAEALQQPPHPPELPSGRPEWAEEPFECLLFDVAGLTMAVPLVSLGSIYTLEGQELTPLFGQPDWFLGLLPCQTGNLRVIDTARWVLAERYRSEFRDGLQYVISIQGCEWGLAVHQVSHSIRLEPQQVKWRGQRSQRPWLAGTVIEQMCALLDVQALAMMLADDARRAGRP